MEFEWNRKSLVEAAQTILDMDDELHTLRTENARLRAVEKEYREFVSSSIKHSDAMAVSMVNLALLSRG